MVEINSHEENPNKDGGKLYFRGLFKWRLLNQNNKVQTNCKVTSLAFFKKLLSQRNAYKTYSELS